MSHDPKKAYLEETDEKEQDEAAPASTPACADGLILLAVQDKRRKHVPAPHRTGTIRNSAFFVSLPGGGAGSPHLHRLLTGGLGRPRSCGRCGGGRWVPRWNLLMERRPAG